jgi:hypothetical protein
VVEEVVGTIPDATVVLAIGGRCSVSRYNLNYN